MKTVEVIPLPPTKPGGEFVLELPPSSKIVGLFARASQCPVVVPGRQPEINVSFILVAIVDNEEMFVPRKFCLVSHGMVLPEKFTYLGTILLGEMDAHLFEVEVV